jgi:prepilin-type processing-associated H-X9-DG protein
MVYILPYLEGDNLFSQLDTDFRPNAGNNANPPPTQWDIANRQVIQSVKPSMFICPSEALKIPPGNVNVGKQNYRGNHGRFPQQNNRNDGIFVIQNPVQFPDRKNGRAWGRALEDVLDGLSNTTAMSERALGDELPTVYTPKGDWVRIPLTTAATIASAVSVRSACLAATDPNPPSAANHDSDGGQNWFNGNLRISLFNHVAPPNTRSCMAPQGTNAQGNATNPVHGSTPPTSYHPGGVNVLMADSSTRFIRDNISADVWSALGGSKDGIPISPGSL